MGQIRRVVARRRPVGAGAGNGEGRVERETGRDCGMRLVKSTKLREGGGQRKNTRSRWLRAQIECSVLVERAVEKGIQRHNIEVAISWLVIAKQLVEKDSILRFANRGATVRQLTGNRRRGPSEAAKSSLLE